MHSLRALTSFWHNLRLFHQHKLLILRPGSLWLLTLTLTRLHEARGHRSTAQITPELTPVDKHYHGPDIVFKRKFRMSIYILLLVTQTQHGVTTPVKLPTEVSASLRLLRCQLQRSFLTELSSPRPRAAIPNPSTASLLGIRNAWSILWWWKYFWGVQV